MRTARIVLPVAVILLGGFPSLWRAASQIDVIYYVGTDQHVHELRFDGTNWHTTDLMTQTGAPNAAASSALTGHVYGTSDNVWYVATDQHVHELAYYGSPATWHTADPTALAAAPNAKTGSPLTSHVYGNSDNIYYIATDGAVHELAFYGSPATWHTVNATALSGAPNPASGSPLTSEVYNSAEHIYFTSADGHVRQISFSGTWGTTDVTYITGAPDATAGSALTSHVYGTSDNVWYIAVDQHVHELAYYGSPASWHTADVTQLAGAPNPISGSSMASNVDPVTTIDDVYFINPNPDVQLLQFNANTGKWTSADITALSGAPHPASGTKMNSHVYGTAENIFFLAADEHVHEMAFSNGSWHVADPSALAGAPHAAIGAGLIGFVGL